jgi:hypothetical protein
MCSFLRYWAGLYGSEDARLIVVGAEQLMIKASDLAVGQDGRGVSRSAAGTVDGTWQVDDHRRANKKENVYLRQCFVCLELASVVCGWNLDPSFYVWCC